MFHSSWKALQSHKVATAELSFQILQLLEQFYYFLRYTSLHEI